MQKLSDRKIRIVPGSGLKVSGPSVPKKGITLFSFFASSRTETRGGSTATLVKEPVLKNPRPSVPPIDLAAVKNWVALEEKIVHDYKEQKTAQLKSAVPLPQTPVKPALLGPSDLSDREKKASSSPVTKKGFTFFGFFASPKTKTPVGNTPTVSKKPVLKDPRASVLRTDLIAVRSWVALEEKIVHDYTAQLKSAVSLPKTPEQQPLPASETFSTQTAVSSTPKASEVRKPLRSPEKTFLKIGKFLLVLGWLAAGVFVLLYAQENFLNRDASQKLSLLQGEKEQLGRFYAEFKDVLKKKNMEMKWLNTQLYDLGLELKAAKDGKAAYEQGLEKKYRSELDSLRGMIQTQNDIVNSLKAQAKAFENVIDQAGMSALSGAAAGFSQEPSPTGGTFVPQGRVASVDERQGFVVISMGATQGARSGRWITISRNDVGLAVGRIDRVYPTMSVAVFRDMSVLHLIQEGDSVSFS